MTLDMTVMSGLMIVHLEIMTVVLLMIETMVVSDMMIMMIVVIMIEGILLAKDIPQILIMKEKEVMIVVMIVVMTEIEDIVAVIQSVKVDMIMMDAIGDGGSMVHTLLNKAHFFAMFYYDPSVMLFTL